MSTHKTVTSAYQRYFPPAVIIDDQVYRAVYLPCLRFTQYAPCNFYHHTREGQIVLFAKEKTYFTKTQRNKLLEHGQEYLYIEDSQSPYYYHYLQQTLTEITQNRHIPQEEKAQAVHDSCTDIMARLFDEPKGPFFAPCPGHYFPLRRTHTAQRQGY